MTGRIKKTILLLVSIVTMFGVACSSQPNNVGTANSEPLVKTDAPKAPNFYFLSSVASG